MSSFEFSQMKALAIDWYSKGYDITDCNVVVTLATAYKMPSLRQTETWLGNRTIESRAIGLDSRSYTSPGWLILSFG